MGVDNVEVPQVEEKNKLIMDGGTLIWGNIIDDLIEGGSKKVRVLELINTTINSKEFSKEYWEKGLEGTYNQEKIKEIIIGAIDFNKVFSIIDYTKGETENLTKNI